MSCLETAATGCLLQYDASCYIDVIVRYALENMKQNVMYHTKLDQLDHEKSSRLDSPVWGEGGFVDSAC